MERKKFAQVYFAFDIKIRKEEYIYITRNTFSNSSRDYNNSIKIITFYAPLEWRRAADEIKLEEF